MCVVEWSVAVHRVEPYEWFELHVHGDGDERGGHRVCVKCVEQCCSADDAGSADECQWDACECVVGGVVECACE